MDNSGDYISREAAVELLSQPITMSMCLSVEECHHKIAQQCIDRYLVENIPAADVRPVVRARWKRNERGNYNCSNCKGEYNAVFGFFFCPNCGARMEES